MGPDGLDPGEIAGFEGFIKTGILQQDLIPLVHGVSGG
jgi:hypothetical protein